MRNVLENPNYTMHVHLKLPQQTQHICITFIQGWTNVEDAGLTLYKCYANVWCLVRRVRKHETLTQCWSYVIYISLTYFDVYMYLYILLFHADMKRQTMVTAFVPTDLTCLIFKCIAISFCYG